MRRVIPHLKEEYFQQREDKTVFNLIAHYLNKYNRRPTKETMFIDLEAVKGLDQDVFEKAADKIDTLDIAEQNDLQWLVDTTESFCQKKALYNSIYLAVDAIEAKKDCPISVGAIPEMIQTALGVSFDTSVGHDYFEDAEDRLHSYKRVEERVPTGIAILDKITMGGFPRKTLNVFMGGVHAGKSLVMCSMAAMNLMMGKNVLYISMEMSEEQVCERVDAQLLDVSTTELREQSHSFLLGRLKRAKAKTKGKLVVEQFPTAGAGVAHFRNLINELRVKKNFIPDIVYIDYLNICISTRMKVGANVGMYQYIKSIAEEVRGLAIEMNLPIISATQTNRGALTSTDPEMGDVSESIGLPATCDSMFALVSTEELRESSRLLIKQLKNRYRDFNLDNKILLAVDFTRFRIMDPNSLDLSEDSAKEVSSLPSTDAKSSNDSNFSILE